MDSKKMTIVLLSPYSIALTLIFIICRALNIIDWHYIWILSPLWIPTAVAVGISITVYLFIGIAYLILFIIDRKKL